MANLCSICNLKTELQTYLKILKQYVKNTKINKGMLYEKIGTIYYQNENYEDALKYLKKAESYFDLNENENSNLLLCTYHKLTYCYIKLDRIENAIIQVNNFLSTKTKYFNVILNFDLIIVYNFQRYDQYRNIFQEYIEKTAQLLDKENIYPCKRFFYNLGIAFCTIDKYQKGIEYLKKCLNRASKYEIDFDFPRLYLYLARAYYVLKDENYIHFYRLTLEHFNENNKLLWKNEEYIFCLTCVALEIVDLCIIKQVSDDLFSKGLYIRKKVKLNIIMHILKYAYFVKTKYEDCLQFGNKHYQYFKNENLFSINQELEFFFVFAMSNYYLVNFKAHFKYLSIMEKIILEAKDQINVDFQITCFSKNFPEFSEIEKFFRPGHFYESKEIQKKRVFDFLLAKLIVYYCQFNARFFTKNNDYNLLRVTYQKTALVINEIKKIEKENLVFDTILCTIMNYYSFLLNKAEQYRQSIDYALQADQLNISHINLPICYANKLFLSANYYFIEEKKKSKDYFHQYCEIFSKKQRIKSITIIK